MGTDGIYQPHSDTVGKTATKKMTSVLPFLILMRKGFLTHTCPASRDTCMQEGPDTHMPCKQGHMHAGCAYRSKGLEGVPVR